MLYVICGVFICKCKVTQTSQTSPKLSSFSSVVKMAQSVKRDVQETDELDEAANKLIPSELLRSPRSRAPLVLSVPETRIESLNLEEEYYEPDPYYTYDDQKSQIVPTDQRLKVPSPDYDSIYSSAFRKNALKKLTHKGNQAKNPKR